MGYDNTIEKSHGGNSNVPNKPTTKNLSRNGISCEKEETCIEKSSFGFCTKYSVYDKCNFNGENAIPDNNQITATIDYSPVMITGKENFFKGINSTNSISIIIVILIFIIIGVALFSFIYVISYTRKPLSKDNLFK